MKITAILGSPHGMKGATGMLLNEVVSAARAAGAEVGVFSLTEYEVKPCRACDVCHKTGSCSIKDDFPKLRDAMAAADGIILASPNYIFSVSAQLKAVLDRCCGPLHCQLFADKYAAAVVSSGGAGHEEVQEYMLRFLQSTGCWTVGSVGAAAFELHQDALRAQQLKAAVELGANLCRAIAARESYPQQQTRRGAFVERMKQLITARKADWQFEYEHWKAKGWL
ncbi:MAG: flavodoxin family protein [Phycisphaerae bacterium]